MGHPQQKRAIATREKLFDAAREIIAAQGYAALRVEDVVKSAGVAKGTFFSHFKDKDALMEQIIGANLHAILDDLERLTAPTSPTEITRILLPLLHAMSIERYVFDVVLRYSGAAAVEEIGPIAECFWRIDTIAARWLTGPAFRKDVSANVLSEGIQAFCIQVIALNFCAIVGQEPLEARLETYLNAWLTPRTAEFN